MIRTRPFQLVTGRTWKGTAFGGARGRTDVPKIVDWYLEDKIQIDPLITHKFTIDDINEALADERRSFNSLSGRVLMKRINKSKAFGVPKRFSVTSQKQLKCEMTFAIYIPEQAKQKTSSPLVSLRTNLYSCQCYGKRRI